MEATIQEHRIWHDIHGTHGTPVLLMMGFGISGRAWAPQVEGLKAHHQVAIYDNRGIGDSETSRCPYDFSTLARDATGLLDHLGWEKAHFVGVSMGGMVLQHLALAFPERVRSLSFIATHPGPVLKGLPSLKGVGHFLVANMSRGERRMRALGRLLYPDAGGNAAASKEAWLHSNRALFAEPANKKAVRHQLRAILKHNTCDELHQLGGLRTLIMHGEKDLLIGSSAARRLHALIPHSKLHIFPDSGHGLTHQNAAEINNMLLTHFQEADTELSE